MRRRTGLILALDRVDTSRALALAESCREHVDAVKVGLPLTLAAGTEIIGKLSRVRDVVCDFKIADIPPIAADIARVAFQSGARGVICHGFAGEDTVRAVVEAAEGEVFVVTEMSHSGGQEFTAPVADRIAHLAVRAGAHGIVAPATRPERVRALRAIVGSLQILAPGAGAQGGRAGDAIRAGADFAIVGRAITDAPDPARAAAAVAAEIAEAGEKH